jgi:ABC-type multidrug transport system permease subunit
MAEYPITINVKFPERLSRLTTFFRYFMVIPQSIVLSFVGIATAVILFISWWAILFTGRYPRWAFDFTSGYLRWTTRVTGYSYYLTDKYPPFSMS